MTYLEQKRKQLEKYYFRKKLQYLDLDNPRTFNEKIQWMKLYDSTPIKTRLADKYQVRDWVREKIGEKYLIPLLGVYDSFEQIDFSKLPEKFVLKWNHGCKYMLFVESRNPLEIYNFEHNRLSMEEARENMNRWGSLGFENMEGYELHYRDIPRKIIAESYIDNSGEDIPDYKFFCFNGKVEFIVVVSGKFVEEHTASFSMYDINWNMLGELCKKNIQIPKPEGLNEMIKIVEILAEGFSHVRVDLYQLNNGTVYFGEMTFTSASGFFRFCGNDKYDRYFGDKIKLTELAYDLDSGKYIQLPAKKPVVINTVKKLFFNTVGLMLKPVRLVKRAIIKKK